MKLRLVMLILSRVLAIIGILFLAIMMFGLGISFSTPRVSIPFFAVFMRGLLILIGIFVLYCFDKWYIR